MKKIILIGGGGNAQVTLSTIDDINQVKPTWEVIGFMDDDKNAKLGNIPNIGKIEAKSIKKYESYNDINYYWSLISVNMKDKLLWKIERLNIEKQKFANIIHPTAVISKYASLGTGISIQPQVCVGPECNIGNHVHMFAQSFVGHGAILEDFSYVANNASIGARVLLKEGSYIGTNAAVREDTIIGKWSVVGMGSVVLSNVSNSTTVVGVPAKPIKKQ